MFALSQISDFKRVYYYLLLTGSIAHLAAQEPGRSCRPLSTRHAPCRPFNPTPTHINPQHNSYSPPPPVSPPPRPTGAHTPPTP